MKRRIASLVLVSVVMTMLPGCSLFPKEEETGDVRIVSEDEVSPNYLMADVMRGDVQDKIEIRCTYTSAAEQEGMFQIADKEIANIPVVMGDQVKAGQVLAELDVKKEKEELNTIISAKDQLTQEEQYLEQLIALTKKEKSLTYGTTEYLDEELAGYESEQKKVQDEMENNALKQSEAEENIAKKQIRAEFDGTVTFVLPVSKSEKSTLDKAYVKVAGNSFEFKGTTDQGELFSVGDEFELVVSSAAEESLMDTVQQAVVKEVSKGQDGDVTTLVLSLKEPNYELTTGDEAFLTLLKAESRDCLYIPVKYLTCVNGKSAVCVPDQEGIRSIREVSTGVSNNEYIEITEGLKDGEKIIK